MGSRWNTAERLFNTFSTDLGKDHPYTKNSHNTIVDNQINTENTL